MLDILGGGGGGGGGAHLLALAKGGARETPNPLSNPFLHGIKVITKTKV